MMAWIGRKIPSEMKIPGIALLLVAAQLAMGLLVSPPGSIAEKYKNLSQWDSGWYGSIAKSGYHTKNPPRPEENTGFFPGFPMAAKAVHMVTGLPEKIALLPAAQGFAAVFWMYVLLFFRRWKSSRRVTLLGVAAILSFPSAFYLIAGYSESMFMAALLGMIYWSRSDHRWKRWIAAGHGFFLGLARAVGIPLLLCLPLIDVLRERKELRRIGEITLATLAASTGFLLYFLFCHLQFGDWLLYFHTQERGWGTTSYPENLVRWDLYSGPGTSLVNIGKVSVDVFGQSMLRLFVWILGVIGLLEMYNIFKGKKAALERAPFLAAAFCMMLLYMMLSLNAPGLIRYAFTLHVMVVLMLVHMTTHGIGTRYRRLAIPCVIIVILYGFFIQKILLERFMRGEWVA